MSRLSLFMKVSLTLIVILFGLVSNLHAELPRVSGVKNFSLLYPSSASLQIPFHGCVVLDHPLPAGEGEYWLSLDELIKDEDFHQIQVLVDANGGILGARAEFRGTLIEWEGARGYAARKRVLFPFLGGDGPEFTKQLPAVYDGNGFGEMVYTFDANRHVSWRKPQGTVLMTEAAYIKHFEKQLRSCNCEDCKNISAQPRVVLPRPVSPARQE